MHVFAKHCFAANLRCIPQPGVVMVYDTSDVTLTCVVEYAGYMAPTLVWSSELGEYHGSVIINSTHVVYVITSLIIHRDICVYITHAQIYIHNYSCTITRSHTCVHAQRRMHLRVQPYMCACLSSHTHAAMHNYVRTCKVQPHTHVYTHMYVLMQPCTYLCTCKHAHARMHLHANIYMHMHIYLYMQCILMHLFTHT